MTPTQLTIGTENSYRK